MQIGKNIKTCFKVAAIAACIVAAYALGGAMVTLATQHAALPGAINGAKLGGLMAAAVVLLCLRDGPLPETPSPDSKLVSNERLSLQ
jgi:hypothetical protein